MRHPALKRRKASLSRLGRPLPASHYDAVMIVLVPVIRIYSVTASLEAALEL